MSNIIVKEEEKELVHLRNLAKIAYESKQYAGQTEVGLLNLMLTAQSLGIPGLKAINGGFYIVNGKVSMSTAMMADMIRRAGHSIKIVEMSKQQCVIIGQRKDNGDSLKFEFTMEDANTAGLTGSPTWKKFPKQMLYNRCMSTVARTLFSDVIGNAYDPDEMKDIKGIPAQDRSLSDPDTGMTIDMDTGEVKEEPQGLSEEQKMQLEICIQAIDDPKIMEDITKFFKVENILDLNQDQYEKCIKALNKKINSKEPK